MAITKAHPNLKVEVHVKGAPLQEYVDDDDQTLDDEVTKYIEASSGDNFEIKYCFFSGFSAHHSILLRLSIDGEYAAGGVFNPGSSIRWNHVHTFKGSREFEDGEYYLRKFCFSQLEINDDGDTRTFKDSLKKKLHRVGVISVRFYWVTAGATYKTPVTVRKDKNLGVVPEKALKGSALSHQASYGAREVMQAYSTIETTKIDETPFAEFTFRYRSRAALKSLLVIPRTPSPVPLEERDINTLTLEESRELLRLQREQMDAAPVIKREGVKRERSSTIINEDNDDDDVTFLSAKRRRLPVTLDENGAEIIDLT
ncbi:hypothetical protein J4E93_011012 [Alternaria ventricosa]|uniref:uncharacterized protein n=1 Tax=Alternaria ventricosa TaxID=1187951 RepID=UPI0020C4A902|nr:uncharacterized protein J4E93_011012 [Alternaria ventricosa]KAI4636714.1 hypothetical protein J4E93_011012 [Alternaria ventricosa]